MRIVLAVLLAIAAAGLTVVPAPTSFAIGALPLLVAFFLGWIRFAVDLVDRIAVELIADLVAPVATVVAFWRGSSGNTWGIGLVLLAAAAAQLLPRAARARSERRRQELAA
jgi:hypothetical protein